MKLDEIRELIHLMKENQISEIDIESEGEKVRLRSNPETPAPHPHHTIPAMHVYPSHPHMPMHHLPAPGHDTGAQAGGGAPQGGGVSDAAPEEDTGIVITSPIVGIFFGAPAPDKPPFVEVGSDIDESTVLCIIEAMKVMNEIKAETSGRVREVLVNNGQSVEYGQPLFVIDPL